MHKFISAFTFCLLLTVQFVHGQNKYLGGYIINPKNDTIKGSIYFEDWAESPKFILFKNLENKEITYDASEIKSFFINNLKLNYESYSAKIKYTSLYPISDITMLFPEVDSSYFFFKVLVNSSKLNLYQLDDKRKNKRYFIKKDGVFVELINYKVYKKNYDNKVFEIKNQDFLMQLENTCKDAKNFNAYLPSYDERSLKKYLTKYNSCFSNNNIVNYSSKKESAYYSLGLIYGNGFNLSLLKLKSIGISTMINPAKLHHNVFIIAKFEKLLPSNDKTKYYSYNLGFGRFIGGKNIQPYLSFSTNLNIERTKSVSFQSNVERYNRDLLLSYSLNFGVTYKKRIIIETSRILSLNKKYGDFGPQISLIIFPLSFKK